MHADPEQSRKNPDPIELAERGEFAKILEMVTDSRLPEIRRAEAVENLAGCLLTPDREHFVAALKELGANLREGSLGQTVESFLAVAKEVVRLDSNQTALSELLNREGNSPKFDSILAHMLLSRPEALEDLSIHAAIERWSELSSSELQIEL